MTYADIETKSFGPGEEGGDGTPSGMARAWYAHMAGLKATYHRLIAANAALRDQRIDMLLDPNASAHKDNDTNWAIPNEIEILLARLLPPWEIDAELESAFATAQRIAVPSTEGLKKRVVAATLPDEKQALLATLLRDTHNRYAARRSERIARRIVALRMARLGLWLTGLIVIVLLVFGFQPQFKINGTLHDLNYGDLAKHNTIVCVFFGILGAYLSRLIAFQNNAASQSFDDLENGYAAHFIFVRLLVGGLCALVLYFLIAGRLLAGELFPEPIATEGEGFGALWKFYDDKGVHYSGPTSNFAKLIVWSFIAGFSERFLPDHLSALEAKSKA
jgi:hypothetical protein